MAEKKQDKTIAERAYELWEKAGRPHGRDQEYWFQAENEGTKPGQRQGVRASEKISAKPGRVPKVTSVVKERRSSRNSGRSPGRKK